MRLIGITGAAGAGKDTAANILVKKHGFSRIGFADPMKEFCKEIFGWTHTQLFGPSEFREIPDPRWDGLTPRKALQTLGTEWGRILCHPDVWVRYAVERAEQSSLPCVIPDVRFENEARCIRDAGGQVWRIERPAIHPAAPGGIRGHTSESGISENMVDWTLQNNSTIEELERVIANIFTIQEFGVTL